MYGGRFLLAACLWLASPSVAHAAEVVGPSVAVKLLDKILHYVQGYKGLTEPGHVVIVHTADPESELFARQLERAINDVGRLAGQPHTTVVMSAETANFERATLIYLAPHVPPPKQAKTLVVAATVSQVEKGAALGFELNGSRPRIVLNAKSGLAFREELVRLARVVSP